LLSDRGVRISFDLRGQPPHPRPVKGDRFETPDSLPTPWLFDITLCPTMCQNCHYRLLFTITIGNQLLRKQHR